MLFKNGNVGRLFSNLINKHILLLSFILPVFILEIAYGTRGIFPFGTKDVLIVDLFHQYAPFLSELQDKLSTSSSLFYSWSGGMGADFYSTFAYYLASPMNILILLFPKDYLTEAVLILTLIKVGLSGTFFCFYLKETYGRKDLSTVAFSLMYALSGYVLAYSWNIMWMEGIYLMPLIICGLIRLIKEGRAMLYVVSLGLLLFSNFYIAFFVVLFTILYYPILLMQFLPEKNFRAVGVKTFQTAVFSILAAGLSAIMILPTLSALQLTSAAGSSFPKSVAQYFSLFDYIARHLPIAEPVIREGLPNIYCGLAALLLAPLFFLSRRFARAEKIAHAVMLFVLIISFNLDVLNFIWHGFHYPNQLPFRNSFVYIFFLVTLSYRAFETRGEFSGRLMAGLVGVVGVLALVAQKLNDKSLGYPEIYIIIILLGIFACVLTMKQERPYKRLQFKHYFFLAVVLEITVSTVMVTGKVDMHEYYSGRNGYLTGTEVTALSKQIEEIKAKETGFYRMEVMPPKTPNDPYLYNYNGISIFSSMQPEKTVKTMADFGFHTNDINSYKYEGSTLPMDSLLGVKYLIRRSGNIDERLKKQLYSKDGLSVYENPYAVSIGYMAPEALKKWSSRASNPFSVQNAFIENLTGIKDVFSDLKLESLYSANGDVTQSDPHHFSFTRKNAGSETRVSIKLKDTGDKNVYLYFDSSANAVDYGYAMAGVRRIDFNAKRSTVVDLGYCKAGEEVTVEVVYKANTDMNGSVGIYANVMDENKFKEAMNIVKGNSMKVEQFADTTVKGSVDAAESGVLFTSIPWHKGWNVWVDGKQTGTYSVDGGFLAFDMVKGKHNIQMYYMTPLFPMGAGISIVSIVLIFVGLFFRLRYFR